MSSEPTYQWLPTSAREVAERGWTSVDVILFSGDAYVDHPSFGPAILGRVLESLGVRVAIVPQPNWRDDLRDFKKLGRPNLFFGVSAGCMDSMVNHYTAAGRKRSDDAYTPDGRPGARPDMPTIVYSRILKELYPDVPVVVGGIEASLRRLTHYDYWQNRLRPSILSESGADMLIYGMGEKPLAELCRLLKKGIPFGRITNVPQSCVLRKSDAPCATNKAWRRIVLFSHEECLSDPEKHARNFRTIEEESNTLQAALLLQTVGEDTVVVNPPYPPMTTGELDRIYALPFTRLPHPRYRNKEIPAYNMIRHSVTLHRGCFGGCSFCTISAHQGKFISSRSEASVLDEVRKVTEMPDFKGTISDLGGPSANMYRMEGRDKRLCGICKRASCAFPVICRNLNTDHGPLLSVYKAVEETKGVKHAFVGSGIRYDLCFHPTSDPASDRRSAEYLETVIRKHLSGRLKVAPEHVDEGVLRLMRKPAFGQFSRLKALFDTVNRKHGQNQQLVPYFISSHPGSTLAAMAELAVATKQLNFQLEQVQDFTPTPMTLATTIYHTGLHPYSLQKIESARSAAEKKRQNMFFFWYKKEFRAPIKEVLRRLGRNDLIRKLYP